MGKTSGLKNFIKSKLFTLLLVLVVMIVFFTLMTDGKYLQPINLRNILNAIVIVTFLAIGEGYLLISGCIDLSAGSVGTAAGIVMGVGIVWWGLPWWIGLLLGLLFGAVCGAVNAALVYRFNFQPFIATLAMSDMAKGLAYVFSDGAHIEIDDPVIGFIGTKNIIGAGRGVVPISLIIAIIFLLVYGIILKKTEFGRKIYLIGGNRKAARLCGINPTKISLILFINSGVLAALAGCIGAARLKSATTTGIISNQFSGITAAMLGGISFGGGSGGMLGCFIGMLILNCFNNGTNLIGLNSYWQQLFNGVLLLIALLFDMISQRSQAKSLTKKSLS